MKDRRYDRLVVGCGRVGEVRRASTLGPEVEGPALFDTGRVGAIPVEFWATFEAGESRMFSALWVLSTTCDGPAFFDTGGVGAIGVGFWATIEPGLH